MVTQSIQRGFFRRGRNDRLSRRARATALLLVGTPGTGKRPVAGYLAQEHGFVHLDFEDEALRQELLALDQAQLRARLEHLRDGGRGVVITWRAGGLDQLEGIQRLRAAGFDAVWFDSDCGAACSAHFADAPHPLRLRFVESFEPDGGFRPVNAVVEELLAARPQSRPEPARVRVRRRASHVRARYGDALGFLAGAAAATAALLVAATGTSTPQLQSARAGGAPPAAVQHVAKLPKQGVLVSGTSLAGVRLGDTMASVKALWGGHFTPCGSCKPAMWFYFYPPPADPVGAGVEFADGRVVAVFTLGGPSGWHTETGIRVGQILDNQFDGKPNGKWLSCAGYSAQLTRSSSSSVTSILTQGAAVYGFALTRPSVSPCH